jgi:hypothetical protein
MTPTRWLLLIPWTYAVFAVQASGAPVPLVFPIVIVTAVVCGGPGGLIYAAVTGLVSDALGSGALGTSLITHTLSAALLMRWCASSGLRFGLAAGLFSGLATIASAVVPAVAAGERLLPEQLAHAGGATAMCSLPTAVLFALAASRLGLLSSRAADPTRLDVANRWSMLTN